MVASGKDLETLCCQWDCHGQEKMIKYLGSQISVKWERGLGGGCVWTAFKPKKHKKYKLRYKKKQRSCLFSPIKWCITHPIEICDGGYRRLETSILELTSYMQIGLHVLVHKHVCIRFVHNMHGILVRTYTGIEGRGRKQGKLFIAALCFTYLCIRVLVYAQ